MARKQQIRNIIIIGGLAYLAYIILNRTLAKVTYGSPSMKIWGLKGTDLEFRIYLPIINESDVPVTVSGFLGQVFYGGASLGTVSLVNPVDVPGFGQTTVEFRMVSGLFGATLEVVNILTNNNPLNWKQANYENVDWSKFRIKGTLKVGKIPVDINTPLLA